MKALNVKAENREGKVIEFKVIARLDSPIEIAYYLMLLFPGEQ